MHCILEVISKLMICLSCMHMIGLATFFIYGHMKKNYRSSDTAPSCNTTPRAKDQVLGLGNYKTRKPQQEANTSARNLLSYSDTACKKPTSRNFTPHQEEQS